MRILLLLFVGILFTSAVTLPHAHATQDASKAAEPELTDAQSGTSLNAPAAVVPKDFQIDAEDSGGFRPLPSPTKTSPLAADSIETTVRRLPAIKKTSGTEPIASGFAEEFSKAYDPINQPALEFRSHPNFAPTQLNIKQAEEEPIEDSILQSQPVDLPQMNQTMASPASNSSVPAFTSNEPPVAEYSLEANGLYNAASHPMSVIDDLPTTEEFQDIQQSDAFPVIADNQDGLFWWKQFVIEPLNENNSTQATDTNSLIFSALKNSPRIQAISKEPLIRELQVAEAQSDFDPVTFVDSQFDDRNDPVGNTLTTGGAPFLEDHIWYSEAGVRKKLQTGADVELGQRLGFQNSNSRFFVPQDQGTATLSLNYTQPLLRGRGSAFNMSQILIAQSAGGVAWEAFKAELQKELETVAEAYWRLYYTRSIYLQKKRNVIRGQKILELLEGRKELDSLPNQIARARSSVLSRKTELVTAFNEVRNSETEIRRVIADPNWLQNQSIELLPTEPAFKADVEVDLPQVVKTAIEYRPEIKEAIQRSKIAAIQYNVSTNELLPELSLIFGGYLSALEGDSGIELAWSRQFQNKPGYYVGVEWEFPLGNRGAKSRMQQRGVQKSQIGHEVNEIMQNVIAEAQVAYRRLTTAHQTLDAAEVSIDAARSDLVQNRQRWKAFALVEGDIADGQNPTTVLDQLLDSQDRLTSAELVYAQAELELKLAEIEIRRVMGTLLMHENVKFTRDYDSQSPAIQLHQIPDVEGEINASDFDTSVPLSPTFRQMKRINKGKTIRRPIGHGLGR